jgi:hypothetical protein
LSRSARRRAALVFSKTILDRKPAIFQIIAVEGGAVMADKPDKPDQITPAKVTVTDVGIAPYIFFEGVPTFGFNNGIVNVTLAATRHLLKEGLPASNVVAVAYLRCNPLAAMELRNALDSALLLAAKTEQTAH